ncbi:SDR family oxidoreductase [Oceanibacterium hippocampi]|uniref:Putative ketoacyl reductase n=1 Tax=Oceanibacterium hippocampi TaxID=745714 RepID=A0A1Y5S2C0_9PROT|nr:SDR family oxidoreductase [Oceanibacterium hippocampi]SLN31072.1 Putative ketoacyl reductase [Oceanibacterium hippocampi]
MKIANKNVVITGAASGIGLELAHRFKREGARSITVADLQEGPLQKVAQDIGGTAVPCDVSKESDIQAVVKAAEAAYGPIDIFCSNAGIARYGWEESPDAIWDMNWKIHVMAHVYAARAVVGGMVERGEGYLVNTASAAGLLSQVDSATYAVTKHAAVAFAETLAIRYGDKGVRVSVLCPQSVRTAMTAGHENHVAAVDGMIEPEVLADCVVETMDREEFLILPHPQVIEYMRRKTADYDRWLSGMRRLRDRFLG